MKKTLLVSSLALFASTAFAADVDVAAPVATLASQNGTVLVNQGEEFVTATEAQVLHAGDRVMVMEAGFAEVHFVDGCALPLESGSLFVVPAESTCATGAVANVQRVGASYAQAVGSRADEDRAQLRQGLVIGGTILAIGILFGEDDDEDPEIPVPVSP